MIRDWGFHHENGKINWYIVFISLIWSADVLGTYIRVTFMRLPILKAGYGYPALYMLYTVLMLFSLRTILRRLKPSCVIFPLLVLIYYLLSYSLNARNFYLLDKYASQFFLMVLPMYFVGLVWNAQELFKPLRLVSLLSIFFAILYKLLFGAKLAASDVAHGDSMGPAYAILPHVCMMTYCALSRKKFIDIIFALVGLAYMLTLGTRGPLVCWGLFIILNYAFVLKKRVALILFAGLLPLSMAFFTEGFQNLLKSIVSLCKQFGVSARIFDRILSGEFLDGTGRDKLKDQVLSQIADNDFVGLGFFSDRTLTKGGYVHNIVLEFWAHFGCVTGSAIFLIIMLMALRKFVTTRSQSMRLFVVLVFSCSIGKLMFSDSYLMYGLFFLMLGLLVNKPRPGLAQ